MGIRSRLKRIYSGIDKKVGGILPGGVQPVDKPKEEPKPAPVSPTVSTPVKTPSYTPISPAPKAPSTPGGGGSSRINPQTGKPEYVLPSGVTIPATEENRRAIISGGGGRNDNPLNLPIPTTNPLVEAITPKPQPIPIKPAPLPQSRIGDIVPPVPPSQFRGDITNKSDVDKFNQGIKDYERKYEEYKNRIESENRIQKAKFYKEITTKPEYAGGYTSARTYNPVYITPPGQVPKVIPAGSLVVPSKYEVPTGKGEAVATMPDKSESVRGKIKSLTGISLPSGTAVYNLLTSGAEYGTLESSKPLSILSVGEGIYNLGSRFQKAQAKAFTYAPTLAVKKITEGKYNADVDFIREKFVNAQGTLGGYSAQAGAATASGVLNVVLTAPMVYQGVKTIFNNEATLGQKIVGVGEVTLGSYFLSQGVGQVGSKITESLKPKIDVEVIKNPEIINFKYSELKFSDVTSGKSFGTYIQPSLEKPAIIRITKTPSVLERIRNKVIPNVFDEPLIIEMPYGKEKLIFSYPKKGIVEYGKPFVISTQKTGRKFISDTIVSGEGTRSEYLELGRRYLNKPGTIFLWKEGKRTTRTGTVTQANTIYAEGNMRKLAVTSEVYETTLPKGFESLTKKQKAEAEFYELFAKIDEKNAARLFKDAFEKRKSLGKTEGSITEYLINLPETPKPSEVNIMMGGGRKSSKEYLQKLYSDTKVETLQKLSPKPSAPPTKAEILAKISPESDYKLELLDKAYSQFRYGYGYKMFGSYKENLAQPDVVISNEALINSKPDVLSLKKNAELVKYDESSLLKDGLKEKTLLNELQVQGQEQFKRSRQGNEQLQRSEQVQGQEQLQRQEQLLQQAQIQLQQLRYKYKSGIDLIKAKFKFKSKDKTKVNNIISNIKKAYDVVTYRGGKEITIASGLPEGLAKKAGTKEVLSNLRASFALKPRGTTAMEDIEFDLPQTFRLSKVQKGRYVQKLTTRFGAKSETKEAQFFRKQKASKIKWF